MAYSVATGSSAATPGVDYLSLSGSAFSATGATTISIPVVVIDDSAVDPDETVTITLTAGAGYTISTPSSATLTIGNVYRVFAALIRT